MKSSKTLIVAVWLKNGKDWDKIFADIKGKMMVTDDEYAIAEEYIANATSSGKKIITIMDSDYPENFKFVSKPPFVVETDTIN